MDMESYGEGVHANVGNELEDELGVDDLGNTPLFDPMEEEGELGVCGTEIWSLEKQHEDLLDVNEVSSIFYNDFPPLPDFPCMSSSSSSSSTPAKAKPIVSSASSTSSASSSSAASWAVLKSEPEHEVNRKNHHHDQMGAIPMALSSTASMEMIPPPSDEIGDVDCMDVMQNFGCMDLLDSNDIWDPSSIFQTENPEEFTQEEGAQQEESQQYLMENNEQFVMQSNNGGVIEAGGLRLSEELGNVFFEWLKLNKEYISAEDMRTIKIRRSTVECASKRLGSTKEGQKLLLKLVLEWVAQNQLKKKRTAGEAATPLPYYQYDQEPFQNPNPNLNCNSVPPDLNTCWSPSPWPAYVVDPATVMTATQAFPMVGYMGDPYSNGTTSLAQLNQTMNGHPFPVSTDQYHILDSAQTWPPPQFAMASPYSPYQESNNNLSPVQSHPQEVARYGIKYHPYHYSSYHGNGEKLVRLGPSATKEARKKRMARQRRIFSHHRHHNHNNHQNQHQNQGVDQHARLDIHDNCINPAAQVNQGNWAYWPPVAAPSASNGGPPVDVSQPYPVDQPPMQGQNYQRQTMVDRRQVGY